ncbi:MAG TPA: metallophosphoesterase [Ktedonobacteraceae bacterium]|nr:metallophosphoesterase [Ktedonobacteraceae bacterium]
MKILHVSDLHYKEAPETWTLLKEAARQFEMLRPDIILITGDMTNDGLDEQFRRVKRFIDSLDFCNVLVIPGNRDQTRTVVPVATERSDLEYFLLTHPDPVTMLDEIDTLEDVNHGRQGKFFEHFAATEFFYRADGVAAVGLNSEPDITPRQVELAMQHFNKGPVGEYRIFCAHHSFLPVPTKKLIPGDVVPRAADILQTLIELNVDLLCCGHIHRSHVWDLSDGRHRLLCCNAGSLLDTSGKKDNGYLEIEIAHDLRIVKRTLFSGRTEMLYHRPRFGEFLQARQQSLSNGTDELLTNLPTTATGDAIDSSDGRTKGKKSKGKK